MTITEAVRKCSKSANAEGPMEEGTSAAFVFLNAAVVFTMNKNRSLSIAVAAGEPTRFDEPIDDLMETRPDED